MSAPVMTQGRRAARLRSAAHALRMVLRGLANRLSCRRRVRGRRNRIEITGAVMRKVRLTVRGDDNVVEILPDAVLRNISIRVDGSGNRLHIGRHCNVKAGSIHFSDSRGTLQIGERTTIYDAAFGITEGGTINIGPDCLLSTGIDIRNGDSHAIVDLASRERTNPARDVRVGEHVWIGTRVLVLKGSDIGDGSIVGAGSVVTGPLPPATLSAGVPARPLRKEVSWQRELPRDRP